MPLQLESAVRFLLDGKNPYVADYFGTPLEQWHYSEQALNPALYHFVMMPWYLLFNLPFYFLGNLFFGFFDSRMALFMLFFGLLAMAWHLLKKQGERRRLLLILLAFNPATFGYLLEGRSDVFMFAFLFGGLCLLSKKQYVLAGLPMGLAFATKQSVWPIFPFYLMFIWIKSNQDWKLLIKRFSWFVLSFGLVVLPFLVWDFDAFLESTVFYLSGSSQNSYPISGYGWGMVLSQANIIKDRMAGYPFWIWQTVIGLPVLVALLRWFSKSVNIKTMIIGYGLFTFVFWYFSRYFNNSHLGYLSMVFISGYFWPKEA